MRGDRTLAAPRGAGGEEDVADVVWLHLRSTRVGFGAGGVGGEREEVLELDDAVTVVVPVDRYLDDGGDPQVRIGVEQLLVPVGLEERADDHQGSCVDALDDVECFGAGVARVDRDDGCAGVLSAEQGDHPVVRVGRPDDDAVACLHPTVDQCAGEIADALM